MILLPISLLLLIPYAILIIYYRQSWLQLKTFDNTEEKNQKNNTLISVIIAARNEEKNIGLCIESILKQTYPAHLFEIIIVDDHSIDSTVAIVNSFTQNNITLINLAAFRTRQSNLNSYKKKAIETGIGFAKGNLIVTTDADCIVQPRWLTTIASYYEDTGSSFYGGSRCVYRSVIK